MSVIENFVPVIQMQLKSQNDYHIAQQFIFLRISGFNNATSAILNRVRKLIILSQKAYFIVSSCWADIFELSLVKNLQFLNLSDFNLTAFNFSLKSCCKSFLKVKRFLSMKAMCLTKNWIISCTRKHDSSYPTLKGTSSNFL